MQEIKFYHDDGFGGTAETIQHLPDEGKFILFGYDMDCSEWEQELSLEELWDAIEMNWRYLKTCGLVGVINSRGEIIEFDVWGHSLLMER